MSQITGELSFTAVTVASKNSITIASTTAVYPGQVGYISAAGQTAQRFAVVSLVDATHMLIKADPKIDDPNFERGTNAAYPSTSSADFTAYNGGNIYFPLQVVPTQQGNDKLPTYGA